MSSGSITASRAVVSIRFVIVVVTELPGLLVAIAASGNVVATNVFWSGGKCERNIHMDSDERVTLT